MSFARIFTGLRGPATLALALLVVSLPATAWAQAEEEEEDLGVPGLRFSTFADDFWWGSVDVAPRPTFVLSPKQTFAPRQSPADLQGRWSGRVQVIRAGKYRFRAEVVGRVTLTVGGQSALAAASTGAEPQSFTSEPIELKYGQAPIEIEFSKTDAKAPAQLRMFWSREGESEAPIPPAVFNHLPATKDPSFSKSQDIRMARKAVVDLRCTACHRRTEDDPKLPPTSFDGLPIDRAPDLAGIGGRLHEAWLYRWLDAPHAWRKRATMPDLFGETPIERVDLYAAVKFLSSLQGSIGVKTSGTRFLGVDQPPKVDPAAVRKSMASVGCIACHRLPGEDAAKFPQLRPLEKLGDKFTAAALGRRLVEPRAFHADSRMPDFQLAAEQPQLLDDVVMYLLGERTSPEPQLPAAPTDDELAERGKSLFADDDLTSFEKLPPAERWTTLGRRVVEARGCVNCHEMKGLTNRLVASPWPTRLANPPEVGEVPTGCLSNQARLPEADYRWSDKPNHGEVLSGFQLLMQMPPQKLHDAPLYTAADQLERNGCLNCHDRGRQAGAFSQRILSFVPLVGDQVLHDVAPPNLAGIGEKLLDKTLAEVIDGKTRARSWMALRMPLFKPEHTAGLAKALASMDGIGPNSPTSSSLTVGGETADDEIVETGRQLVGRTGLNCVSCHDIRGIKSIGVRGPDLANVARRVRPEWFEQWLLDPQRLAPGTRMPTVFFGGKSAAPQFYDGHPQQQLTAMWAYLSQGNKLELPSLAPPANAIVAGGENPRFTPTDRPILVRGFMPGTAGLRGLAVGMPQRLHFAFDTERCALAAAWQGDFAEVGGWYDNGRGSVDENGVKPLGKIVWRGLEEPQWYAEPPPNEVRENFGTALTPKFEAAWSHEKGSPIAGVRYSFDVRPGEHVTIEERWLVSNSPKGPAFVRRFTATGRASKPGLRILVCEHQERFVDGRAEYYSAAALWRVAAQNRGLGVGFKNDQTHRHFVTIEELTEGKPLTFSFEYQRLAEPKKE